MASPLSASLFSIQRNNYATLAILTAVGYDYVLTFQKEVEYIWCQPWTSVSTMFILVRYFGLCSVGIGAVGGSTFMPGPAKVRLILSSITNWTFLLFLGAADYVMVLRVWAMYNRSRLVLISLLLLLSVEVISIVVSSAIYSDPKYVSVDVIQLTIYTFCALEFASAIWAQVNSILQLTSGAVLCILVTTEYIRRSLEIYRVRQQWQLNRYINLFIREGIAYFFAIFLYNLFIILINWEQLPVAGWQITMLFVGENVPIFTLAPRFILSMREMYARGVQAGHGDGIDSGFGLSTLSSRDAARTAIVFADAGEHESLEAREEIPMEAVGC